MNYQNNFDIIVLGGGFTGCAAAEAAAKQGKSVLLLEASGYLGGAASNCLIYPFMMWWTRVDDGEGGKKRHDLSRGLYTVYHDELMARGGKYRELFDIQSKYSREEVSAE